MKICPRCQKTYVDDNLNFCLEDGSVLTQAASAEPQTVFVNEPHPKQPQPQIQHTTGGQTGGQAGWNTPQQYSMQPPKKSSKTWVWVLLILGVVVLVCGGGFAGLVFIGMQADKAANASNGITRTTIPTPGGNKNTTTTNFANTATNATNVTTSARTDMESVDLAAWVKDFSAFGNTEFTNGEFIMSSKKKGFYYVLVAPEEYQTDKADIRVTLRNVDNAAGSLGYGLIFHSNPTPLEQDYAFLIDTKRKKYRVVHHLPQDEKSVVTWTASTAIKEGSEENVLEARDLDDKIELYINGTMVTSIKNIYGYAGGVAGLYSGDGVKIAFKNLEIRK
ncbi:MAG: hypothetical protein ABIP78_06760 [Pyrinomonadaceae bacterium]